jgi:high-affinity K+ transport system ATPase subunit B
MKKFTIPVLWQVYSCMEIEANSLDEAIEIAEDSNLPKDGEYVDGSFIIDHDAISDHNQN